MNQRPITLWEKPQGLARVHGILWCLGTVAHECLKNAVIAAAMATACGVVGQWMFSRISWPQIFSIFPLVFALTAVLVLVNRCFGRELWVNPHDTVVLRHFWRHDRFRVEEITSVRCEARDGGWAILKIVAGTRKGPRHIEFVTDASEADRALLLEALTQRDGKVKHLEG